MAKATSPKLYSKFLMAGSILTIGLGICLIGYNPLASIAVTSIGVITLIRS